MMAHLLFIQGEAKVAHTTGSSFTVLAALLLAAPVEELVFREGLQRSLGHLLGPGAPGLWARWVSPANALSSLVFAWLHGWHRSWWLALAVLPCSLWLGWLYERGHGVRPCIAWHLLMNGAWWLALSFGAGWLPVDATV